MSEESLLFRVGAKIEDFEKKMGVVEKKFAQVGSKFESVGKKLTTGVSLPLVAIGGLAFKASVDFESAFAGVKKTVDATDEELAQMRQGLRDMAKEGPTSATALSGIAEAAGQLGIQTPNILGFTKVVADLGVSSNLAGEEGATMLARFANITQMPQGDFERLGSTIVALGNAGASTEAEIMAMGLRIAGAGAQVNMTEPQILGLANALSSVGIEAEAGGSAISKVMIEMASEVANGGEKLSKFAEVAGMSSTDFQKAFKTDAAGALVSFVEGLGKMKTEGENTFGVLDELGFSEIRVRDALLRASGAGDLFRTSLELGSKAWQENTALSNEAAQRYATTESKLATLRNKLTDVGITLGDALAPAFMKALDAAQPFIGAIENLANWFAQLDPGVQQVIVSIGLFLAALGPVIYIGGTLFNTISGIAGAMKLLAGAQGIGGVVNFAKTLQTAFTMWTSGALTFGGALNFALGPVTLIVLGIAAVIAIGYLLYKHWDEISAFIVKVWEWIKNAAVSVWTAISDFFVNLWTSITGALTSAWESIKNGIVTAWNAIADFFREWFGVILLGILTGGLGLLVMIIAKNWDTIRDGIVTAWETIKTTIATWATNAWNAVVNVLTGLPKWFADMWESAKKWTIDALANLATAVVNGAVNLKNGLIDGLESAWNYLKSLPSRLWDAGKAAIKGLVEGFLSISIPIPTFGISWKDGPMGLQIPSLDIGVNWRDLRSFVPFLADGGIVDSPTLAMIGEAGPEAVVPLSQYDRGGGGGNMVNVYWSSLLNPSQAEVKRVAALINTELGRTGGGFA